MTKETQGCADEGLGELYRQTAIYTDVSKTKGLECFLDDRDSYRFRLPGHCGIFTVEMCAIYFACNLIKSKLIALAPLRD
jgi:hypothetical protein